MRTHDFVRRLSLSNVDNSRMSSIKDCGQQVRRLRCSHTRTRRKPMRAQGVLLGFFTLVLIHVVLDRLIVLLGGSFVIPAQGTINDPGNRTETQWQMKTTTTQPTLSACKNTKIKRTRPRAADRLESSNKIHTLPIAIRSQSTR